MRRTLQIAAGQTVTANAVLSLSVTADVVVTGTRTFRNIADLQNPAENLVGVASAASQGAITAQQLEARPIMRPAEVLERFPDSLPASIAARARPTSTTCAASISITGPTSPRRSRVFR